MKTFKDLELNSEIYILEYKKYQTTSMSLKRKKIINIKETMGGYEISFGEGREFDKFKTAKLSVSVFEVKFGSQVKYYFSDKQKMINHLRAEKRELNNKVDMIDTLLFRNL